MANHAGEVITLKGGAVVGGGGGISAAAAVAKVMNLPPGFRFHPTDEELVVQYLRRKALSRPLPAYVIPEIELYKFEPWDLPLGIGGGNQKVRYFFTLREPKYPNGAGGRANRAAGSGYWKATGRDRPVMGSREELVVGMKKVLVFYRGKPPRGTRTDWVMHEYRLLPSAPLPPTAVPVRTAAAAAPLPPAVPSPSARAAVSAVPSQDWVLCRVFKKKKAGAARGREDMEEESDEEMEEEEVGEGIAAAAPNFIDFLGPPRGGGGGGRAAAANPAASESSCVTEVASEEVESVAEGGGGGDGCCNSTTMALAPK